MLKIKSLLASLLYATLLFLGKVSHSTATEYRVEITGVVSDVMGMVNPADDWAGPPPEVAPEFAARFAVGQTVVTKYTFADRVLDGAAADDWGQYSLSGTPVGSVVVDGELFQLRPGVIHLRTEETDRYLFHSYTSQEISNPVSAMGIMLDIDLEGYGLLQSDALVPPPQTWESATGDLYFASSPYWQGIRFTIDRVVVNAVPEPSLVAVAVALLGICSFSRPKRTRC